MSYHEIEHPNIGRIRGLRKSEDVAQFLGVRYANVEDRFSRGVLCEYAQGANELLDATKIGPLGAIPFDSCELEQRLIQKSLPIPKFEYSDTDCLTLNISVPSLRDSSRVPVLAFVHGGGFTTGSNSYPQYDLARITTMSVEMAMPIVVVGVNYRVGLPGFLHSPVMKNAGYKPNNGLDDQRLALRWIQQYITGFAGDPRRVTFLGESAGATSGFFHLHQQEPLFHQLVAMSGTPLLRPRPAQLVAESFEGAARALGIEGLRENEQLEALARVSTPMLIEQLGRILSVGPIVDGEVIPEAATFDKLRQSANVRRLFPGQLQSTRLLIGDCQADGMIWSSRLSQRSDIFPKTLERCLSRVLDQIDATLSSKIISAYGIDTSATTNNEDNIQPVLRFGNDVTFALPATACARAFSNLGTHVFLYHFDCPNPWEGRWKGHATHIQDIAFVLQNYAEYLSQGQRQSAQTFTTHIIEFVNGKQPWRRHGDETGSEAMVYDAEMEGDEDKSRVFRDVYGPETGRRNVLMELLAEDMLDKLLDAWNMFMRDSHGGDGPMETGGPTGLSHIPDR